METIDEPGATFPDPDNMDPMRSPFSMRSMRDQIENVLLLLVAAVVGVAVLLSTFGT